MRILIVSNFYPPYYLGGYELRCCEVAKGLQRRGHDVHVLTGTYGLPSPGRRFTRPVHEKRDGVAIHRALGQYAYGARRLPRPWTFWQARSELADARYFRMLLHRLNPDVVNWWSMKGLSKTLLPIPATRNFPDMHCIDDTWMISEFGRDGQIGSAFWHRFWDGAWGPPAARPLVRQVTRRWERHLTRADIPTRYLPSRPRHVVFVSRYLETLYRNAGLSFSSTEIVYGGVPAATFLAQDHRPAIDGSLRLLYAGQITRGRGLHTAVEAIAQVPPEHRPQLTLTIVGDGVRDYIRQVRERIAQLDLADTVAFRGKVAYDAMPAVYTAHDVLVFTSTLDEGLPLTMAEAMLSGCAVITTGSGGAMEMAALAELPVFPKNNPQALALLLTDLVTDRQRLRVIAARGQKIACREFESERMIGRIEAAMRKLHDAPSRNSEPCTAPTGIPPASWRERAGTIRLAARSH
jgi:glycogen(starch) synthase